MQEICKLSVQIGMTCQWILHRLILGKGYQLDSDVQLLVIPSGRVVSALDFGNGVPGSNPVRGCHTYSSLLDWNLNQEPITFIVWDTTSYKLLYIMLPFTW